MNIKRAKQEIKNTVQAYLAKDALGEYAIPSIRQRPLLLLGPPGIGKTQIMEQVSRECGIALVAYTITHHTRQSAVGLPFIEHKAYNGKEYSVTRYTMSEIIASVYERMEETGLKEGILFIDEINCVSETLAPTMLQFLQCKTFGNQKMPEGWIIAAAGNPPEYNKSVRDFDIVTLDRVKRMDITADLSVWKEYARSVGIHSAIMSYLELRPDNFYRIEADVDGTQFVTARGWEDLSTLIQVYEKEKLPIDEDVIHQYLQHIKIAKDFAAYLDLYRKYRDDYGVEEILKGHVEPPVYQRLLKAAFDERLSLVSLLNSGLDSFFRTAQFEDRVTDELYQALRRFKAGLNSTEMAPTNLLGSQIDTMEANFESRRIAGLIDRKALELHKTCVTLLREYQHQLAGEPLLIGSASFDLVQGEFAKQVEKREAAAQKASDALENAFDFMENAFGEGQEMLVFITELALGPDSNAFITDNGCDRYYKYNQNLLLGNRRAEINKEINANLTRDTERGMSALPQGML